MLTAAGAGGCRERAGGGDGRGPVEPVLSGNAGTQNAVSTQRPVKLEISSLTRLGPEDGKSVLRVYAALVDAQGASVGPAGLDTPEFEGARLVVILEPRDTGVERRRVWRVEFGDAQSRWRLFDALVTRSYALGLSDVPAWADGGGTLTVRVETAQGASVWAGTRELGR